MTRSLRLGVLGLGLLCLLQAAPSRLATRGPLAAAERSYGPAHRALLAALGTTRPIVGRLTGLAAHRPLRSVAAAPSPAAPAPRAASATAPAPLHDSPPPATLPSSSAATPAPLHDSPPPTPPSSSAATPARPAASGGWPVSAELVHAVRAAAERDPSPHNLATLAVLDLALGRLDQAIAGLRRGLAGRPDDPAMLSDLAACLLARGAGSADPRPALAALDAAEHSLHAGPTLPALFNAALAHEQLGLRQGAILAWDRYLENDPRSGWAAEAAARRERLLREPSAGREVQNLLSRPATEAAAAGRNPWADRQLGEGTLLARWAARAQDGDDAGATAALDQAAALAAGLPAGGGRLLAASIAAIRSAEDSADGERRQRLIRGHLAYRAGLRLRLAERVTEAYPRGVQAAADLAAAGSPFALCARLLVAATAPAPDWAELRHIEEEAAAADFPSVAADVEVRQAARLTGEGRLAAAADRYQKAADRYRLLSEDEPAAVVVAMQAEIWARAGDDDRAMTALGKALATAPAVSDPWQRYSLYVVASHAAAGTHRRAAVELRREAAEVCGDLPERPLCTLDSLLWLARLTPDPEEAEGLFAQAATLLAGQPPSNGRERSRMDLDLAHAQQLGAPGRPAADQERAIDLLEEVAGRYRQAGIQPAVTLARAARSQTLAWRGRAEEADAEGRAALQHFRDWHRGGAAPTAFAALAPEMREVFERLIDLEVEAARGAAAPEAFLLAEEMHQRLAPSRAPDLAPPQAADLRRWQDTVPPGAAVVELAAVGGRTLAWILTPGRLDQVTLPAAPRLAARIAHLPRQRDLAAWQQDAGPLFDQLVAPLLARLPAGTARLAIVPDVGLFSVPFRGLWDRAHLCYLDDRLAVSLAPSVHQLLDPPAGLPSTAAAPPPLPALSLGFGTFAADLGLDPLPLAPREAGAVRQVYGRTAAGTTATSATRTPPTPDATGDAAACATAADWPAFRRCAPRARVIHLATHAAAGATAETSWLAWPGETVTLDRLWRELPDLPAHPLVVLSSCQSVAAAGGGEGLGGLARPFLASGASAVVGTLWKLEDEDAAVLFPEFHRLFRQSRDATQALRLATLALPAARSRPWAWAGVEAVTTSP